MIILQVIRALESLARSSLAATVTARATVRSEPESEFSRTWAAGDSDPGVLWRSCPACPARGGACGQHGAYISALHHYIKVFVHAMM